MQFPVKDFFFWHLIFCFIVGNTRASKILLFLVFLLTTFFFFFFARLVMGYSWVLFVDYFLLSPVNVNPAPTFSMILLTILFRICVRLPLSSIDEVIACISQLEGVVKCVFSEAFSSASYLNCIHHPLGCG